MTAADTSLPSNFAHQSTGCAVSFSSPDHPLLQQLEVWFSQQSAADLSQLHQQLQHELRENGSAGEPWQSGARTLDCLPWLIEEAQWLQLEQGLAQRHRLLAAVIADLYGPQQLLKNQILPADLLYLSGNYLLPACGLLSNADAWLPLLSTDIGHNAAGEFCVLADFSQLPDGLGYLLEHRLAFNHCGSQLPALPKAQLAGFFRQLLQLLQQPAADRSTLVGLLAPVAKNAGYFEQAFLANYLDIALVHGADLMFKDGRLWLKTLTGLQPVASLLRYLADAKTDPLELEANGSGCAGLLQSIRQQQLFCANPPGTALVDSGLLLPFMPQLCQALLDEPLLLPSAPALWLGDDHQLQQFFAAPAKYRLVDQRDGRRYTLSELTAAEDPAGSFGAITAQILQQPAAFIAIEFQPLSQLPCWQPTMGQQQLAGQLRLFSLQQSGKVSVLPGAYARLASDAITLQNAEVPQAMLTVKDVWVLADRGQTSSLLQTSAQQLSLSRQSGLVPSRVADHLFWLGRYNERLNLICRALRSALPLIANPQAHLQANSADTAEAGNDALALLRFCLKANGSQMLPGTSLSLPDLLEQMFEPDNATGIVAVLKHLLFNAQSVREYFGEDTWFVLDKLQSAIYQWPQQLKWQQPAALLRQLDEIILLQTAIYGLNNETMSRTQTLRMMDLGQHLERALQTSALLQTVFVPPQPAPPTSAALMEAVLRMADTLMTYRRRYRSELHPLAIIDLLLLDDSTPRSVGYQCARIQRQCAKLPQLTASTMLSPEQRIALELVSLLQLVDPQSLFDHDQQATPALGMLLNQLQHRLRQLSDSITLSYFNHAQQHSAWQSF